MFLEFFSLRRLDLIEMFVHAVERAELLDEPFRPFLADARHTGYVVDRVAPDGHNVDDFFRRQAKYFRDSVRVVHDFPAGVKQPNTVADELKKIFVGCGDHHFVAAIACDAGERADQVVRFPILDSDHRNAKALQNLVDERELHGQIVRHRPAVLFVIGERFMPSF